MNAPQGWTFADSNALDWQPMGDSYAMKLLGVADGKMLAMFRFEPGFDGAAHPHNEPEFTYVLEGSIVSNGVQMEAGHGYAAVAGTTHEEFRTDTGCTVVSVFAAPSG